MDTEEEAKKLIATACQLGLDGEYYATELMEDQSLENLFAFGRRLEAIHNADKERVDAAD